MTSRRKPTVRQASQVGWVYTLCLDPPYPPDALSRTGQAGHYSGWALNLGRRLAVHAGGGVHAARLLQVQIASGGSFRLARAERGTRDRETQLKYCGFTRRCPICQAGKAGISFAELGWVYVLHRDLPAPPGEVAEPQHHIVYTDAPAVRPDAPITRKAERLLRVPGPGKGQGRWRLVAVERNTRDRASQLERYQPVRYCPACNPARAGAGATVMPRAAADKAALPGLSSAVDFPQANPLAVCGADALGPLVRPPRAGQQGSSRGLVRGRS